jgi:hypothetical protein
MTAECCGGNLPLQAEKGHYHTFAEMAETGLTAINSGAGAIGFPQPARKSNTGLLSFSGASGTGRSYTKIRNLLHAASPLLSVYCNYSINLCIRQVFQNPLSFDRKWSMI